MKLTKGICMHVVSLLIVIVFCGLVSPRPVAASGMSFSIYVDADVDEDGMMDMWTSVVDSSWGCTHSSYYTIAHIVSPTNRTSDSGSSGLQSDANLSVVDDYEDYSAYTTGTYTCSCMFGSTIGFGGSAQVIKVRPFIARMIYSHALSDVAPHGPTSKDRYFKQDCSGFCQPEMLEYDHSVGLGHSYLEIKGFDTVNEYQKTRYCKARTTPMTSLPGCTPT